MKDIKYLHLITFLLIGIKVTAQYEYPGEEDSIKTVKKSKYTGSKLFFGGVPGLMFGSITYIELPPYVGYKFTPYLWAGVGPFYQYYKERASGYETSIYGGKVFTQLFLVRDLREKLNINLGDVFLYGESSMLNLEPLFYDAASNLYYKDDRKWINITLVGFGIRYPIGERSGFSFNVMWDISQNPEHSYQNPEVRIGFDF
jgi:hypothetical protein